MALGREPLLKGYHHGSPVHIGTDESEDALTLVVFQEIDGRFQLLETVRIESEPRPPEREAQVGER